MMSSAPALQNYQLGDCLGKGAFGHVFRALNWITGETVAIKQIQMVNIPKSQLGEIMSEINLLKNLHHPRIVRYGGYVKTKDALYVILEYCENGSLASICKRFGKFPESLVAVYISQVLEGLQYLHDQGVCHRDIKAANILAIKDGSVKLADFGVATQAHLADNSVVGSPFWMAPEVIDQSGASTASDIWSVGCVVIELLEGKPPYSNLPQMSALWAIVQHDQMPIPEGASPVVKDFLLHCFQKDPNLRVSARKLLKHPWMRQLDNNNFENNNNNNNGNNGDNNTQSIYEGNSNYTPNKDKNISETYDVAVQKVQEWNEALKSPPKSSKSQKSLFPIRESKTSSTFSPLRRTSLNIDSPNSANQSQSSGVSVGDMSSQKPLTARDNKRESVLRETQENEEDNWDDDFAGTITFSKVVELNDQGTADLGKPSSSDDNTQTIRPPSISSQRKVENEKVIEDYSDLGGDEDDKIFSEKISSLRQKEGLFHPNDLKHSRLNKDTNGGFKVPTSLRKPKDPERPPAMRPSTQFKPSQHSPTNSKHMRSRSSIIPNSSNSKDQNVRLMEQDRKSSDLAKYSEVDNEDFDDVFGKAPPSANGESGQTLQLTTKLTNKSWLGDEFPDDEDPFAQIEDDFAETDLESNLVRDRHARLCAMVIELVGNLHSGQSDLELNDTCDELLNILSEFPDMHSQFVSARGMLSTLEVLEGKPAKDVIFKLLRMINLLVSVDAGLVESFCLVGGIGVVINYAHKRYSHELRLEAATFIAHVTHTSILTLQMFIACRGFKVLVDLLDEEAQDLVYEGVSGISSVFDLNHSTNKIEFCRIFAKEGLLEPLSSALSISLKDDSEEAIEVREQSTKIYLIFAQVAQTDKVVLKYLGTRSILRKLLKCCLSIDLNSGGILVNLLKVFKHVSTNANMLEVLQNSNAIDVFVKILESRIEGKGDRSNEISSQLLQIFFSLTRLSPSRQEEAAQAGLIPQLKRVYETSSPLKQFALPILCDFAHAGKSCRALLWKHSGLELYVRLLGDPYFQVSALEAILVWLQNETDRVESYLIQLKPLESILSMLIYSKANSFEATLEPLLKICRLSKGIALGIARSSFFKRIIERLSHKKALVRLNLLRILRIVLEYNPERKNIVQQYNISSTVEKLSVNDSAILVRELAKEMITLFTSPSSPTKTNKYQRRSASDNTNQPNVLLPLPTKYRPQKRIPSRNTDRII